MTDLQGRDLDRAIAKAMGFEPVVVHDVHVMRDTDGFLSFLPEYHRSLDALRDGPERLLREAGWMLGVFDTDRGVEAQWDSPDSIYEEVAPTESEARARAVLPALRAMKEGAE